MVIVWRAVVDVVVGGRGAVSAPRVGGPDPYDFPPPCRGAHKGAPLQA